MPIHVFKGFLCYKIWLTLPVHFLVITSIFLGDVIAFFGLYWYISFQLIPKDIAKGEHFL